MQHKICGFLKKILYNTKVNKKWVAGKDSLGALKTSERMFLK